MYLMLNSPDIHRFCKILSTRKGQEKKCDTIIPVILWAEVKWKPLIIIAGITETFKPNTMATATTVQTLPQQYNGKWELPQWTPGLHC